MTIDARRLDLENAFMVASVKIQLPEPLARFVDEQTRSGGHSSPEEYIRHILDVERQRSAHQRVEQMLIEGLESGEPLPVEPDWKNRVRDEAARRRSER